MKPALRTTIEMLTHSLITDPPIFYEDSYFKTGEDAWQCYCCSENTPVIYDRPGHNLSCDYTNFPHSDTCPVTLAKHIGELLEGEPT